MISRLAKLFRNRVHVARMRFYSGNKRFAHLSDAEIELCEAASARLAVFVHIPKMGGTTIKNLMVANCGRRYRAFTRGSTTFARIRRFPSISVRFRRIVPTAIIWHLRQMSGREGERMFGQAGNLCIFDHP